MEGGVARAVHLELKLERNTLLLTVDNKDALGRRLEQTSISYRT